MQAFLSRRTFSVVQGGLASRRYGLRAGVPQGAVISPFLFCLFIEDLAEVCRRQGTHVLKLADDVALVSYSFGAAGRKEVQGALDAAFIWSLRRRMVFSPKKSVAIAFGRKRAQKPLFLGHGPGQMEVKWVDKVKYLGVWFNRSLNWSYHGEQVLEKARKSSNFLAILLARAKLPPHIVRTVLLATVAAQIRYGFPVWKPNMKHQKQLQELILHPLRTALGLPTSAHGLSVLVEFGLPDMGTWHEQAQLSFQRRALVTLRDHQDAGCGYSRHPTHVQAKEGWGLARDWRLTAANWNAGSRGFSLQQLKRLAVRRTYAAVESEQKRLITWKHTSGMSEYLLPRVGDRPAVARLRARLRLDRSTLKESLQRRSILGPASMRCDLCHRPREEDLEHVLLRCPAYRSPRKKLKATLSRLSLSLTVQVVLGDLSLGLPVSVRREALAVTGDYLSAIYSIRGQL